MAGVHVPAVPVVHPFALVGAQGAVVAEGDDLVADADDMPAAPHAGGLHFGTSPAYGPRGIVPGGLVVYRFGEYAVSRDELTTIAVTFLAVGLLSALLRLTAAGVRMRAVVESPRMTELAGVNANRVGSLSWMLSGLFAGLAGVLLAPLFPQVSADNFFLLIVAAIAAAAFASLSSLPLALVGGLLHILPVHGPLLREAVHPVYTCACTHLTTK